jgi:hypothetical protein
MNTPRRRAHTLMARGDDPEPGCSLGFIRMCPGHRQAIQAASAISRTPLMRAL